MDSMKVLIADNEPQIRSLFASVLGALEIPFDLAADGGECLAKLKTRDYDILFLDARMPNGGGVEVLSSLKQSQSSTDTIIISAQDDQTSIQDMFSLGAAAHLMKPFTSGAIEDVLRTLADKRKARTGSASSKP